MKIEYPGSLHNHTQYSNLRLRDCIIKEKDLIDYAIELGHKVVAITDHESISNAIKVQKYYKKIKETNPDFKVILGNEIYLCRNGLNNDNFNSSTDKYYHFILLAKDEIGHRQIREISTRAWHRSYMARGMRRVPTYYQDLFDIIGANPGHVIASTACLGGALPTQLLKYKQTTHEGLWNQIVNWFTKLNELFGQDNFYFELQPSKNKDQIYVNRKLIELSQEYGIPYIITTDSHYLKKEDRFIHKAFLNAQNGDREVDDFYATTYLMKTEELESLLDLTEEELQTAYNNILNIYNRCEDYNLLKPLKIPQLPWKNLGSYGIAEDTWKARIPYLEIFWNSDYEGDNQLADGIVLTIEKDPRLQTQEIYDAINECLDMTWVSSKKNNTHWSAYYLNLQKIIEECWTAGTLIGPGRGSGVGFILLYLLGITQINPLWESTKTYAWRFLNPDRVSVLDVDIDIEGSKRSQVLTHLRKVYGEDRVANVATFGTEKAKSAIQTACRGLGIDVDIAQYLSSMVVADRGIQRTLKQTFYGDEENDIPVNKQFVVEMTENYPEVWEVAQKIEGLVCRLGEHAGGVIFVDEPFTNSTALMRAPNGDIITQFDLHDCEDVSLIKYDLLSVEALDKMHICLDLLVEQNYVQPEPTLKETYEKVIGIYGLERNDKKMWEKIWNHEIHSLFQMEQQSGIQGIALTKPESVDDLATLNSVIRLMAQEKGAEQPLNKFARFKKNIAFWYEEMRSYGLTMEEQKILEPVVKLSYGICESQEGFMQLVQMPECGGFDLSWADRLRKSIAKKNPAEYEQLQKEYFEQVKNKQLSYNLCNYVWNVLVATSRGYGFNKSHTLAYSLIALQEMNLAFKYPTIFWNCACLISDSGGIEVNENENEEEVLEEDYWGESASLSDNTFELDFESEEDDDDDDEEEVTDKAAETKKKAKSKTTDYDKVAKALGQIQAAGIVISPPNINLSGLTFKPIPTEDKIIYGIKGITRVGDDLIKEIINNRPYSSLQDFLDKVKVNKLQAVNLIKSGAFDSFGDREEIMKEYILSVSDQKKRLTLQNMAMLINKNMLPESLNFEVKVFNFNKYLKKFKEGINYILDDIAFNFYESNFDCDNVFVENNQKYIQQTAWDKIYKKQMDPVREYLKANNSQLLTELNNRLFQETYDKYASGTLSKWEMDSICYYHHEHELAKVNNAIYELADFHKLPEEPIVDRTFPSKDGKTIPIYKTFRFAGTVLGKNKDKGLVTLLTTSGVVSVRIFKAQFTEYDKQISRRNPDGTKTVIEKSWFSRGSKLILNGFRRGNDLVLKKYKHTPCSVLGYITKINDDGTLEYKTEREEA